MEHTDAKGRIMDALSGDRPDIPPVAIFTQSSTVSQMDAVDSPWPLAHTSPTAMASLGSAQHTMFGFDSVRVPFCVTVEADALGCDVDLGGRISSPTVMRGFKLDPFGGETDDPSSLPSIDDFLSDDRTQCVSAAVDILSHRFENVPVVAGITGPLTVLSQMVGAENMVLGTVMCPDLVRMVEGAVCPPDGIYWIAGRFRCGCDPSRRGIRFTGSDRSLDVHEPVWRFHRKDVER